MKPLYHPRARSYEVTECLSLTPRGASLLLHGYLLFVQGEEQLPKEQTSDQKVSQRAPEYTDAVPSPGQGWILSSLRKEGKDP